MKTKKIALALSVVFTVALFCFLFVFFTDYYRCQNFKEPIFVVPAETADDGGSGTYQGLGYKVIVKKHIDPEHGAVLDCVEMYVGKKVVAAAISDSLSAESEVISADADSADENESYVEPLDFDGDGEISLNDFLSQNELSEDEFFGKVKEIYNVTDVEIELLKKGDIAIVPGIGLNCFGDEPPCEDIGK